MLPVACKSGEAAVKRALVAAPGPVAVDGTPLSGCLIRASDSADLQLVGATYLAVAADLASEARADRESAAATRLGYLVGAVRRGAARTQGVHDEMVRRIEQELVIVDTRAAAFRTGERAGRSSG